MNKTIDEQTQTEPEVALLKEDSLDVMATWYDQQIALARKSEQLAVLKASIARSRLEETLAMMKIAEITAPLTATEQGAQQDTASGPATPGKVAPLKPVNCSPSDSRN